MNLWFLGWGFVLLHYVALLLDQPQGWSHLVLTLVARWALDLCGLIFLRAACAAGMKVCGIDRPFLIALAVPVLAQSGLCVLGSRHPALLFGSLGLFLLPAAFTALQRSRAGRQQTVLCTAFAVFAVGVLPLAARSPALVADGVLCLVFLSSAYLYGTSVSRMTRGSLAATTGLIGWGLSYPIVGLLLHLHPETALDRTIVELPQYLVIVGIILTLIEEYISKTERLAMHDPLTDLPNRRLFEERLIATMEEARINRTTVACLVIDVDNFKSINDTLGHSAGDQLLRALAVRLSWHMSPRDILARTGGDEFTALLAGVTDEHHLRFIAGAMMSAASVPIMVDGKPVDVRISVGIVLSPDDADDIDGLRRAADEAMYSAKRRGGSLLAFASEE